MRYFAISIFVAASLVAATTLARAGASRRGRAMVRDAGPDPTSPRTTRHTVAALAVPDEPPPPAKPAPGMSRSPRRRRPARSPGARRHRVRLVARNARVAASQRRWLRAGGRATRRRLATARWSRSARAGARRFDRKSGLVAVGGRRSTGWASARILVWRGSAGGAASKRGGADDRPDYLAALTLGSNPTATTSQGDGSVVITADQLVAHAVGDHVLRDWCANRKTKRSAPPIHVALYVVPVSLLTSSAAPRRSRDALRVIDRRRLARFVCWAKNWIGPRGCNAPWREPSATDILTQRPAWLSVWLPSSRTTSCTW